MDDEETVEGVVCFGVTIPGRRPGEGPYAASITLLKVRATEDRVPLLIDDLRLLAGRLSDPLRADRATPGAGAAAVGPSR
jgi:DNA-binding IclR family transcriptional regulator